MAIPKVTAVCLSGVALLAGAEARLNTPSLDVRSWIPMVDEILLSKVGPVHTRTTTTSPSTVSPGGEMPGPVTSTSTKMPPMQFFQALANNVFLTKLLFAAEHGVHVPEQHNRVLTNPIQLIESIPFPFNVISNGLKRAAEAAGVDLDSYRKAIENSYEGKNAAMISHGILPPSILAQAMEGLDAQSFMVFLPNLDQDYLQSLRPLLPTSLAEIPSVQEVMGAFNVAEGSQAEATLRSLFPFFSVDTLESYMRMAADGLPIDQILNIRSDEQDQEVVQQEEQQQEDAASFRMWIPFLDDVLLSKYIPFLQNREAEGSTPISASTIEELMNMLPIAHLSALLGQQ